MKNALSWRQANACENATHPRCSCRCRGALHGARRGRPEQLHPNDPHHAEPIDSQNELELPEPQRVSLEREAEIRSSLPADVSAELDRLGVFRRAARKAGFDL